MRAALAVGPIEEGTMEATQNSQPVVRLKIKELGPAECLARLRETQVARIGVSVDALPSILPVFVTVLDQSVAFRTVPGTKLWAATNGAIVAVEADAFDHATGEGWSVVVRGRATQITSPQRIARVRQSHMWSWIGAGAAEHFVEVGLDLVTGRSIRPSED